MSQQNAHYFEERSRNRRTSSARLAGERFPTRLNSNARTPTPVYPRDASHAACFKLRRTQTVSRTGALPDAKLPTHSS